MITYTKRDVARKVSEKLGKPVCDVEPLVNAVIESMLEIMMSADTECRIEIRDFGIFTIKETKAKPRARNPKTNEEIYVPARRKSHFKPGKTLREFLQQPLEELEEV